jgi:hypothetical protein
MTLHVICVAYHRAVGLAGLICSFLQQTDNRWTLTIVHDGTVPQDVQQAVNHFKDPRIHFTHTKERNGQWGHPNRAMMLESLGGACDDYVLMTNDDNYYVPMFVELFLGCCKADTGMIYCNTLHNYMKYDILYTRLKENMIDMGSFIVRQSVAKAVGFKHRHEQADGRYAEECAVECAHNHFGIIYIDKVLFVHN